MSSAKGASWPSAVGFGAWDSREIGRPCVIRLGDAYWMFYAGCDTWFEWKIGAAISSDGVGWQRLDNAPILVPPRRRIEGGGWHSYQDPCVVDLDGGLVLAATAVGDGPGARIIAAASRDAVEWTLPDVIAEVAPDPGAAADLRAPWIVRVGAAWHLFATVVRTAGNGDRATSIVRFVRENGAWKLAGTVAVAPVGVELDHSTVAQLPGGRWGLWCSAFKGGSWEIHMASSPDLETWTQLMPAISGDPSMPLETSGVFAPCVLAEADGLSMWHLTSSRTSDGMSVAVVLRVSSDGAAWTRKAQLPVFSPRPGIAVRPW